jgi:replicative DNA helicase
MQPSADKPNLRVVRPEGGSASNASELRIPHSPEAEEAVLGSLLLDRETVAKVAATLKPEHFFSLERANLYQAILQLYAAGTPPDLVTIRNELKLLGALGEGEGQVKPAYLVSLMSKTASPYHASHYAAIVLKHWLARQLISECSQTIGAACEGEGLSEPGELLAGHSTRLQGLATSLTGLNPAYFLSHEKSLEYPLELARQQSELDANNSADPWNQKRPGLRFGWSAFDGRDNFEPPALCLLPATLTIVLARTGGGKTLAAMQIADNNAQAGLKVLYFHVELNQAQMLARRYCRLTGITVLAQLAGRLEEEQQAELLRATGQISNWPGRVDFVHSPNWTVEKLVGELKARHYALMASGGRGYDLVVLDYLQRLGRPEQLGRAMEHEALAYNVRAFSDAANELNLAALMTSQVGRNEQRQYEPPDLDEGLGTGDIERCSNQLLALAISQDKDVVKYTIRKSTFGESGLCGELMYDARRLRFL